MMPMVTELEEALQEALRREPESEGITVQELASRLGWSILRVRAALHRLGSRVVVGWVYRPSIDGRMLRVPCYRLRD
jgi:DNA-binding GntR family transcriptional regulator